MQMLFKKVEVSVNSDNSDTVSSYDGEGIQYDKELSLCIAKRNLEKFATYNHEITEASIEILLSRFMPNFYSEYYSFRIPHDLTAISLGEIHNTYDKRLNSCETPCLQAHY